MERVPLQSTLIFVKCISMHDATVGCNGNTFFIKNLMSCCHELTFVFLNRIMNELLRVYLEQHIFFKLLYYIGSNNYEWKLVLTSIMSSLFRLVRTLISINSFMTRGFDDQTLLSSS